MLSNACNVGPKTVTIDNGELKNGNHYLILLSKDFKLSSKNCLKQILLVLLKSVVLAFFLRLKENEDG